MLKKILGSLCLFIFVNTHFTLGQEILYTANDYYRELKYFKAIPYYKKALEKKVTYEATKKLADCYWLTNDTKNAETWYLKAGDFPNRSPEVFFVAGLAMKCNGKYDSAKYYFKLYEEESFDTVRAQAFMASCDTARNWIANPTSNKVVNLYKLNTRNAEFCPSFANGKLVFTSDRAKTDSTNEKIKIYEWLGTPFYKLYEATLTDSNISEAKPLNSINGKYHTGPACYSSTTDTIVYSSTQVNKQVKDYKNQMEIFFAYKNGNDYTNVKPYSFDHPNYSLTHPTLSADGQRLYFASDKPGGYGGTDIYCAEWDGVKWQDPYNLGALVNTAFDEQFPYERKKGDLYFASQGHIGMGGFDIFEARGEDKNWNKPTNLKYPINSQLDDFGISFTKGKNEGYFSSNRSGGEGSDDIYLFNLLPELVKPVDTTPTLALKPVEVPQDIKIVASTKTLNMNKLTLRNQVAFKKVGSDSLLSVDGNINAKDFYLVTGYVYGLIDADSNDKTLRLKDAVITIINRESGKTTQTRTDENGNFEFEHNPNINKYALRADKTGYFAHSIEFDVNYLPKKGEEVELTKGREAFVLDNIQYEYNSDKVVNKSFVALNKLVAILNEQPNKKIQLMSYSDSRGSDDYNLKLSQRRAVSIKNYLVSQGINSDRIGSNGGGETNLIIENAVTEEQHAANRRCEFVLK